MSHPESSFFSLPVQFPIQIAPVRLFILFMPFPKDFYMRNQYVIATVEANSNFSTGGISTWQHRNDDIAMCRVVLNSNANRNGEH